MCVNCGDLSIIIENVLQNDVDEVLSRILYVQRREPSSVCNLGKFYNVWCNSTSLNYVNIFYKINSYYYSHYTHSS